MSDSPPSRIYAGLSGVELSVESFELGEGIVLRQTFAHLFSPFLVAFSRPGTEGYHPGPWSAAEGGSGFDIHAELSVPSECNILGSGSSGSDVIWWIAALLRIVRYPYLSVPVVSDHPFSAVPTLDREARLHPNEVQPRIMAPGDETDTDLTEEVLEWVKDRWVAAGRLAFSHRRLRTTFQAFDSATVAGKSSSSLLALWGGLEQLFGFGRLRLAAFISAYLHPPGDQRLTSYRKILKLYDARSTAAHTANAIEIEPLIDSYVLTRNVLVRVVNEGRVPTQSDLEELLFGGRESERA